MEENVDAVDDPVPRRRRNPRNADVPASTSKLSTPTSKIAGCPATRGAPFRVTEYPACSNVPVVLVGLCPSAAAFPAGQSAAKFGYVEAERNRERRSKHERVMMTRPRKASTGT
jgi:hypothetical protein